MYALDQECTHLPKENESQVPGMATLQRTEAWVLRASAQLWLHQNLVYVIKGDKSVCLCELLPHYWPYVLWILGAKDSWDIAFEGDWAALSVVWLELNVNCGQQAGDIQSPAMSYVKQQDIRKQQQKLGATSPVSGFMWGIKQGAHAFSLTIGHTHHYHHQTNMQKI